MPNFSLPNNYTSGLNLYDTQVAIKMVKDFFQTLLAERLHLLRVSAPLMVDPRSGLNDNLNGVERPVAFDIKNQNGRVKAYKENIYHQMQNHRFIASGTDKAKYI